ncbi:MAG: BON domain-containing protein [bacterium]|jgi:osmotically-inducible protein OsmY
MRLAKYLVALALMLGPAMAADQPTDDEIYDNVRQRLAANRDVKGGGIEVEVKEGVVVLRGKVLEAKQKTKAEKVAKKVKGVKKVVNELRIELAATGR